MGKDKGKEAQVQRRVEQGNFGKKNVKAESQSVGTGEMRAAHRGLGEKAAISGWM